MTDMLRYAKLDTLCLIRSAYFLTFSVLFSAGFYVMFTMVAQDAISDSPPLRPRLHALHVRLRRVLRRTQRRGHPPWHERGEGWARQVLLTPLSGAAYLAAKALTAWLATLPAAVVVFALGAFANDVSMPAADWIAALAVIWGAGLVFVLAGLVVGLVAVGESAQYISLASSSPSPCSAASGSPSTTSLRPPPLRRLPPDPRPRPTRHPRHPERRRRTRTAPPSWYWCAGGWPWPGWY
ncbi:hypothetical protein AB7952_16960 [Streptomyces sp. PG2]